MFICLYISSVKLGIVSFVLCCIPGTKAVPDPYQVLLKNKNFHWMN